MGELDAEHKVKDVAVQDKVLTEAKLSVCDSPVVEINEIITYAKDLREKFVSIEKDIDVEMENVEESLARRQLYVKMELLRLDFIQLCLVDKYLSELGHVTAGKDKDKINKLKNSELGQTITETLNYLDGLRYKMRIRPVPVHKALKVLHCILGLVGMIFCLGILVPLSSLRIIHTPLMKLGVPPHMLPIDLFQTWFTRVCLAYWGVSTLWEGQEKIDVSRSYIGMFNHQSSMDPWVICAGKLPYRLIGKKTLFMIPILGWLMAVWGHISIDRKNLTKAKHSFERALTVIKRYRRSIGVFPEGTRTIIGRPCDFKKGSFHTALQAKLPIVPTVMVGMAELWPSGTIANSPGIVYVKVMDPVHVEDNDTYKTLMDKVHRAILKGYAEPVKNVKLNTNIVFDWLSLPAAYLVLYLLYSCLFK